MSVGRSPVLYRNFQKFYYYFHATNDNLRNDLHILYIYELFNYSIIYYIIYIFLSSSPMHFLKLLLGNVIHIPSPAFSVKYIPPQKYSPPIPPNSRQNPLSNRCLSLTPSHQLLRHPRYHDKRSLATSGGTSKLRYRALTSRDPFSSDA